MHGIPYQRKGAKARRNKKRVILPLCASAPSR
jgi:hypothetical protein